MCQAESLKLLKQPIDFSGGVESTSAFHETIEELVCYKNIPWDSVEIVGPFLTCQEIVWRTTLTKFKFLKAF